MNESFKNRFVAQTSGSALSLIAMGIGINIVMGELTAVLKIPLYLDSVGTVFVAVSCGPYAGALCGLLSNVTAGILINPPMMFFVPVSIVIGLFTGFVASRGAFATLPKAIVFGLMQGIISALVSAPIAAFVFGGMTMGGTDFLVLYFRSMGNNVLNSVFYQGLAADPIDKCCSYVVVFLVVSRLPVSLRNRLPRLGAR